MGDRVFPPPTPASPPAPRHLSDQDTVFRNALVGACARFRGFRVVDGKPTTTAQLPGSNLLQHMKTLYVLICDAYGNSHGRFFSA